METTLIITSLYAVNSNSFVRAKAQGNFLDSIVQLCGLILS